MKTSNHPKRLERITDKPYPPAGAKETGAVILYVLSIPDATAAVARAIRAGASSATFVPLVGGAVELDLPRPRGTERGNRVVAFAASELSDTQRARVATVAPTVIWLPVKGARPRLGPGTPDEK